MQTNTPPQPERRTRLQHCQYVRIAAHSGKSLTAVANIYNGGPCRPLTYHSVVKSATELGLPLPYTPKFSPTPKRVTR